jgi:hypothetical protein
VILEDLNFQAKLSCINLVAVLNDRNLSSVFLISSFEL